MNKPPNTLNKEAAALIELAQFKCAGCRTAWRLREGKHWGSYRAVGGKQCEAPSERQQLREIAAKARGE